MIVRFQLDGTTYTVGYNKENAYHWAVTKSDNGVFKKTSPKPSDLGLPTEHLGKITALTTQDDPSLINLDFF